MALLSVVSSARYTPTDKPFISIESFDCLYAGRPIYCLESVNTGVLPTRCFTLAYSSALLTLHCMSPLAFIGYTLSVSVWMFVIDITSSLVGTSGRTTWLSMRAWKFGRVSCDCALRRMFIRGHEPQLMSA